MFRNGGGGVFVELQVNLARNWHPTSTAQCFPVKQQEKLWGKGVVWTWNCGERELCCMALWCSSNLLKHCGFTTEFLGITRVSQWSDVISGYMTRRDRVAPCSTPQFSVDCHTKNVVRLLCPPLSNKSFLQMPLQNKDIEYQHLLLFTCHSHRKCVWNYSIENKLMK